ncbi:C1 family peptidase [Leekyejoonella antrihumi]|nr:C1 family peptidase [Leekyejoonella antrihumi]
MKHADIVRAVRAAETTWHPSESSSNHLTAAALRLRCGNVAAATPAPREPRQPLDVAEVNHRYAALTDGGAYATQLRGRGPVALPPRPISLPPRPIPPHPPTPTPPPLPTPAPSRPGIVDWRTQQGRSVITPVKDQGGCGSCVAFAVTALVESRVRIEHGLTVDLSEADLFYGSGCKCAVGWNPVGAISHVKSAGEPLEHEFPYVDVDTAYRALPARGGMLVRPTSDDSCTSVDDRKNYLAHVGPMVGCFDVYEDFGTYGGGVYRHLVGERVGSHCIQIIGYDDTQSCWICKNSWGTGWGESGFFRIAYGQCGIDDTGSILGIGSSPFYGVGGTQLGPDYTPHDFIGTFDGSGHDKILRYLPAEKEWSLIDADHHLSTSPSGSTSNFGQVGDGRPFWTGDFTGSGNTELTFYTPSDGNWWLGRNIGGQLSWSLAGNTLGHGAGANNFGQVADGRPFWTGDFTGSGNTEITFYTPADGNWWLGQFSTTGTLTWSLAGNTNGFGQVADGRPFWTGDFTGDKHLDILFYYPGDHNWWLGQFSTTGTLTWSLAGNTNGFGQVADGRPFWTGDFTGDKHQDILFYYPGDHNWWLGQFSTTGTLTWSLAGNTNGFGQVADGRPFWVGDFTGNGRKDVMFFYPGDANWWLGEFGATGALTWSNIGNTLIAPALA